MKNDDDHIMMSRCNIDIDILTKHIAITGARVHHWSTTVRVMLFTWCDHPD